jgi:hypothetical protein
MADSGLPVARTLTVNGYRRCSPRRVAKRLNRPGLLSTETARSIAVALAGQFPPA